MRTIDDAELTGWQGFYVYYGCSVRDTVVVGAAPVLADHSTRPNSLVECLTSMSRNSASCAAAGSSRANRKRAALAIPLANHNEFANSGPTFNVTIPAPCERRRR